MQADAVTGKRIAVGVGSRGIDRITDVVAHRRSRCSRPRAREPFIVPVMGNHGGATAEGQAGILEGLGITEATVGAPIRPRMDTRAGRPHASRHAGLRRRRRRSTPTASILVNRVKPHTDFESTRIGSGLLKMAAIGLGKSEGAAACHRAAGRLGFEAVLLDGRAR